MNLMFETDMGNSGSALGLYSTEHDLININLEAILVESCMNFYGGFIPEEFQDFDTFEEFLIDKICRIMTHENIHRALNLVLGVGFCVAFDRLPYWITEYLENLAVI